MGCNGGGGVVYGKTNVVRRRPLIPVDYQVRVLQVAGATVFVVSFLHGQSVPVGAFVGALRGSGRPVTEHRGGRTRMLIRRRFEV